MVRIHPCPPKKLLSVNLTAFLLINIINNTKEKGVLKMIFSTNKEKGNTSLGIAITYYSSNGYTVSIPLNDTQDYDLIVDKDNVIKRVQVKSTSFKDKNDHYQISLKSCGGTKGATYKTVVDTAIEELFILVENKDMYIIPKKEINNRSTLTICDKYKEYKVNL